jgi:hypothetical protein
MAVRIGKMEGAGPYYGLSLEELQLHGSHFPLKKTSS